MAQRSGPTQTASIVGVKREYASDSENSDDGSEDERKPDVKRLAMSSTSTSPPPTSFIKSVTIPEAVVLDRDDPKFASQPFWDETEYEGWEKKHKSDHGFSKYSFITDLSGRALTEKERRNSVFAKRGKKLFIEAYNRGEEPEKWALATETLEEAFVNILMSKSIEMAMGGGWKVRKYLHLKWSEWTDSRNKGQFGPRTPISLFSLSTLSFLTDVPHGRSLLYGPGACRC